MDAPAFPNVSTTGPQGMSKREWFAGLAMHALLEAVDIADGIMKALEVTVPERASAVDGKNGKDGMECASAEPRDPRAEG